MSWWRPSLIALLLFGSLQPTASGGEPYDEYQVKAVFVARFFNFIHWPKTAVARDLCVIGDNPFGNDLRDVLEASNKATGKSLQFRKISGIPKLADCAIVYIAKSERYRLANILEAVAKQPVLTVSSLKAFIPQGGMIQFVLIDNRVRLDLHLKRLRDVGLNPDVNLIRIANRVINE